MDDMTETFYFYASHDEEGRTELVVPDEFLADEIDFDEEF